MRHLSLPLASDVPALPRRVGAFPARRRLVGLPGLPQRLLPRQLAARRAAVAVAPIAVGAQEEHLPALPPAARHEPKRIPHRTRCTPSSGGTPRPGVRLALPQARHAHGHAAPDGPLSGCWGALRLPGRAFRPTGVVPHSPPTSFRSPPPDPHLKNLSPVSVLDTNAVPARATTTTTMVITVDINSTSTHFHADLSGRSQAKPRADEQEPDTRRCRARASGQMTAKLSRPKASGVDPAVVRGKPRTLTWGDLASRLKGRRGRARSGARSQQRP